MASTTSGSFISHKYGNIYLELSWSSTKKSNGVTTLSWTVTGRGAPYLDATYFRTTASLLIYGNNVWNSGTNAWVYYNDKVAGSGSFDITHTGSGELAFTAEFRVSKMYTSYGTRQDTSSTWRLPSNPPYYTCTAPSISCSASYVKPNGKLKIQWSGASGDGSSSGITGYKVWYKPTGESSWYGSSGSTALSSSTTDYEFSLGELTDCRGKTITAKVEVQGGGGSSYYASNTVELTGTKINYRPAGPTITSTTRTTVPSAGGAVTFRVSPGAANDSNQTCTVKYSTSADSTKRECSKDSQGWYLTKTVSTDTDFYFWTWDGYEYNTSANKASQSISVNTVPNISGITLAQSNSTTNIQVHITNGASGTGTNNTYTIGYVYNGSYKEIASGVTSPYTIDDMRKYINQDFGALQEGQTYSYQIWAQRHDGIETGTVFTRTNSNNFTMPTMILNSLNSYFDPETETIEDAIVDERLQGYVSKRLSFELSGSNLDLYDNVKLTQGLYSLDGDGKLLDVSYIDVSDLQPPSRTFDGKISVAEFNNGLFKIALAQPKTKIKTPAIAPTLTNGGDTPFSPLPYQPLCDDNLYVDIQAGQMAEGIIPEEAPELILRIGERGAWALPRVSEYIGAHYKYHFAGQRLYTNYFQNMQNQNITTGHIQLTNSFGDTIVADFDLPFSMMVEPEVDMSGEPNMLYPGDFKAGVKYPSLEYWEFIKEEMPIYCDFSVYAYSNPKIRIVYRKLDNSSRELLGEPWETEWIDMTPDDDTLQPGYKNPLKYSITEEIISSFEPLQKDCQVEFEAHITCTDGFNEKSVVYNFGSFPAKAHYAPQGRFKSGMINGNLIEGECALEQHGHSWTEAYREVVPTGFFVRQGDSLIKNPTSNFQFDEGNKTYWIDRSVFSRPSDEGGGEYDYLYFLPCYSSLLCAVITERAENTGWDFTKYGRTFFATTYEQEGGTELIIYNTLPTMSYRMNGVGINTLNIAEDAALQIQASKLRNMVVFGGMGNSASIDLQTMEQVGFVYQISGGSWDDEPVGELIRVIADDFIQSAGDKTLVEGIVPMYKQYDDDTTATHPGSWLEDNFLTHYDYIDGMPILYSSDEYGEVQYDVYYTYEGEIEYGGYTFEKWREGGDAIDGEYLYLLPITILTYS